MASTPQSTSPVNEIDTQIADWKALHELGQTLLQPGPLDEKLQEALQAVCNSHQTTRGVISLYVPKNGTLDVRASTGMPKEALIGINRIAPGSGVCGRAFSRGERFIVEQFDSEECLIEFQPWAKEFSIHASYSTPFFNSSHTAVGVLSFYFDHPHRPTERELLLADLCAGTIGLFLERARSEEVVVYSEARYRALTQTLSAVIWSWTPDISNFSDVHGWETFTGQSPVEQNGCGWLNAVHPEDREQIRLGWEAARASIRPYEFHYQLLNRDGRYRHVRAVAAPVLDKSGMVVEWIGSCEDVTAIRDAQDTLIATNRRKDEFMAILSHELRNPLSVTKTAASLLQRRETGTPRTEHLGQVIARQVGHMSRLVEDLVDVSRIAQGLVILRAVEVNMINVVNAAIEQITPMVDAKHHSLTFHIPVQACLVNGDKTRLVQVVANLLSNAARYTPDHGSIVVDLRSSGEEICLTVKDNGIGIDTENLSTLFDLYMQAERSNDRTNGGLGLGLALVKNLIELHDGSVSVTSDGKHMGSSFSVTLPSASASNQASLV